MSQKPISPFIASMTVSYEQKATFSFVPCQLITDSSRLSTTRSTAPATKVPTVLFTFTSSPVTVSKFTCKNNQRAMNSKYAHIKL